MAGKYWTHSWNPVTGCTPYSPGCDHCWAAAMCARFSHLHGLQTIHTVEGEPNEIEPRPFNVPAFHPERFKALARIPIGSVVATCWLGDLFHEKVRRDWQHAVIGAMDDQPFSTYLLLTKRAAHLWDVLSTRHAAGWVWAGFSACTNADLRRAVDAAEPVHRAGWHTWLSLEPLLESLWDAELTAALAHFDSVVLGGETGPGARIMQPAWARGVERACELTGTPLYFKQWGSALAVEIRKGRLGHCEDVLTRLPGRQAVGWPLPLGGKS